MVQIFFLYLSSFGRREALFGQSFWNIGSTSNKSFLGVVLLQCKRIFLKRFACKTGFSNSYPVVLARLWKYALAFTSFSSNLQQQSHRENKSFFCLTLNFLLLSSLAIDQRKPAAKCILSYSGEGQNMFSVAVKYRVSKGGSEFAMLFPYCFVLSGVLRTVLLLY